MGTTLITLGATLWLGWAALVRWLADRPRPDAESIFFYQFLRVYSRVVHSLRITGREHVPPETYPGKLIVVCNHTAGIDPLLVQAATPFFVRWMMASDMRVPMLEPFWRFAEIIDVDRSGKDRSSAREAIRYLEAGGVLGIFPEGGIARPRGTILPFMPGVGLIIRRTGARVLPVIIRGTPVVPTAWQSLYTKSHATIEFRPVIDYSADRRSAEDIAADLHEKYLAWTGWTPSGTQSRRRRGADTSASAPNRAL